ncbi:recombinase family protein [Streptomyces sp. SM12]|uniref:recombinase family protein n=1 Tax=Streptomyces sp. SM12 TaxID=1071602 RepID=UPI000CD4A20F|nr:recombinase family protein [Streptomyces sp. SM12]
MTSQSAPEDPAQLIDLFCRKSAARQHAGRKEISISAQEARGRAVADALGLTVRKVWREVGSASRFSKRKSRTEQDAALTALERGESGALWIYRLDRWDRRGAGAILRIIEPADGIPRRLLFDNGDPDRPGIELDSTNPRDRRELIRRAEDAREETELLSKRVRDAKQWQRDTGQWVSPVVPYGLQLVMVVEHDEDDEPYEVRKLTPDERPAPVVDGSLTRMTRAEVVQKIHSLPAEGLTQRGVCYELARLGVLSPTGQPHWGHPTVRDMIANPVYAGWQTTGRQEGVANRRVLYRNAAGERVSVMAPGTTPLVTDTEQRIAQGATRTPASPTGKPADRPHDVRAKHLLTGLLKCAGCTGAMSWCGTGYSCGRSRNSGGCTAPATVPRITGEAYVHARWEARLAALDPDDPLLMEVAERWAARQDPSGAEDAVAAANALAGAELALARVWADRRAGLYDGPSEAYFRPALDEATATVGAARDALAAVATSRGADIGFLLDPLSVEGAWTEANLPLRRVLLQVAITSITARKAPYRGAPFAGHARVRIHWADGSSDPTW